MAVRVRDGRGRPMLGCALVVALACTTFAEEAPEAEGEQGTEGEAVAASPPGADGVPSPEFMAQIYAASDEGGRLYKEERYAEALPFLLEAAQYGFKVAQASTADILLNGRGEVARNTQAGIGWLSVAAEPPTLGTLEETYAQMLAQLSDDQATAARRLAIRYRAAYGAAEHRVSCQVFGTVVEELRCRFTDDPNIEEHLRGVSDSSQGVQVDAEGGYTEEMIVTAPVVRAPAPERGRMPSGAFISEIYEAMNRGQQLYREKRYKEALPFLVVAAKRGFKWAQASAADIYLHGRGGVPTDLEAGIGWLGVAAQPRTSNSILSFYKESRDLMPERYGEEAIDAIVADYRHQYGHQEHRVACRLDRDHGNAWSFNFKTLRCHFIDEATQCQAFSITEDELQSEWTCKPVRGSRAVDARPY